MNTRNGKITAFLLTFAILVALCIPVSALFESSSDAGLYNKIIRLHVLANSDSDADQSLKLKVRDGILETVAGLVGDTTDFDAAKAVLEANLDEISSAAQAVLAREGSAYSVKVTLTRENYPTRIYDGITLPAGVYTSLRVLIGAAEGHNWWCILFPQLCVNVASKTVSGTEAVNVGIVDDSDDKLLAAGLTPSQIKLITGDTPDVVVRFRLLEFIESIIGRFS